MEGFDIPGEAGTLRLISAGALRNALAAAATAYSAQDRVGVAAVADTAGGIEKRLAAGEPADVIGSSLDSLNRLAAAGVVAGAT